MNRQLYQMGGMGTLPMDFGQPLQVSQPMMNPSFAPMQSMSNPMANYGQTPLMMARGGIASLVDREKYGLGSKLKRFVRKIIPNELSELAVKAAPFVAPFNPLLAAGMAGIGGFDQTGRIGQSLKSAALTYGAGQLGRYVGGAGFQEGIDPFAGYSSSGSFGGLGSLFTSPIGTQTGLQLGQYEIFGGPGSEQFKLNQNAITPQQTYLGGDTVKTIPVETGPVSTTPVETFNPTDVYDPNIDYSGAGTRYADPAPLPPVKEQGYVDLIKKAGSLEDIPLSERFGAVKDIGSKALQDVLYKPMINPKTGVTTYILDKNVVGSIAIGAYSYYDALQKLKDAGDPEPEKTLTEEEYQRLRVDPQKEKYKDTLKEEAFGIRKAKGGRITDRKNYFLGKMVSATSVAQPGETMSQGGGSGLGGMIAKLIQRNPEMFRRVMNPPRLMASSRTDFIDTDGNGIDDREEAAGGGLMGEGVLSIKLTPAQAMAMGGRIGYQMGGLGSMDPLLALQRSPFDQYGFSDPVISALTGNVFTSGQRFRDVTDLSSGPDIQRAQSLGYSQPEIQELGLQRDMLASYRRALSEASLGSTFQANPEKTALDLANSLRQMYMNPQQAQIQQQPIQQQVVTQQQTQQPQMSYNEMQKADYARRMGALEDKFARQGTSATQYIQDMTNLLAQMKTSGGVDPLGAMQSKYYTESGGGSVSEGSPRGIDARFIINRAQKAEQDAAARVTPKKANGGRINYFMGSEIPVRQNQGGITELDLRAKGGYIPVGIKEKADDVPAMLSRNEFVFTADAVRGAGGGNINKGAQKMYKLMKSLEKKVKKMKKLKK